MSEHGHGGHRDRMRARFLESGLSGFAPHEVLELLLFYAIPQRDVNPLSHQLLDKFGSLEGVLSAPPEQLAQMKGIGLNTATLIALMRPLARYVAKEQLGDKPVITNKKEAKSFCHHLFLGTKDETLYVICLNAQGSVLRAIPAIQGTIDEIPIYPRAIVGAALLQNAHSVLLAHNHPSGVREPSSADIKTTELLVHAFAAVDIQVMDHLVYAGGDCVSISQWQAFQRIAPEYEREKAKAADTMRPGRPKTGVARETEGGFLDDWKGFFEPSAESGESESE